METQIPSVLNVPNSCNKNNSNIFTCIVKLRMKDIIIPILCITIIFLLSLDIKNPILADLEKQNV